MSRRRPTSIARSIVSLLKDNRLLQNAVNLILSSGVISLFGFVFWIIIARNFTSQDVGVATTLIASGLLIALLSQAGFDTTFIRFLPKSKKRNQHINTGLVLSGLISIVLATAYCVVVPLFSPKLSFLSDNPIYAIGFVLFALFATWNTLTNAALIAYRKTKFILIIDTIFSLVKISLPFLITSGGAMAIFMVVGIAQVVNVALSVFVLIRYFGYRPRFSIDRSIIKETKRYSAGVYGSSVLNLLPDSILPLIVINQLGASEAAYFYITFAIANLVYTIAFAITQVLLAETANDEEKFSEHARHGIKISLALLTPAIALVVVLAPYILNIFGEAYAAGGTQMLRIMALSGFFVMGYSFLSFYFKHTKKLVPLILMTAVNAVTILGLSAPLAAKFGLAGIGWSWMIGTVVAMIVGYVSYVIVRNFALKTVNPEKPKKILVTHVYSEDNKGDAALLSVLISDMHTQYPEAKMTILTLDSVRDNHKFESIPVRNSFMYYSLNRYKAKPLILFYSLHVMISTLMWATFYRAFRISIPTPKQVKAVCELYSSSDLVLPVGGGYLRSQKKGVGSLLNVTQLLHPYVFTKIIGKPTVLYTQSIGPFASRNEERVVRLTLNKCVEAAIIREKISMKLLKQIGVRIPLYKSVDSGFAFNAISKYSLRGQFNIDTEQLLFGITARKWLNADAQTIYENALVQTIDHITSRYGARVVLIPQVTAEFHGDDDRIVHDRIARLVKDKAKVTSLRKRLTHAQIRQAYNDLDFLIGTRFHSVIFALISHVPAIAIEYEHKTGGIMHDLQLDDWVVKMEEVNSESLTRLTDELVRDKKQYIKHLSDVLPEYISNCSAPRQIVADHYRKISKD